MHAEALTTEEFTDWMRGYQSAWEQRDPTAAALLFAPDARYYWTPLDPPHEGPAAIAAAWEAAVSGQRDVRFTFDVFAVSGRTGMAIWRADFQRHPQPAKVRIEGVLAAEFARDGQCRVFREWWHSSESQG